MKLKFRFMLICVALLGVSFFLAACELNDNAEDSVSNPSLSVEPSYMLIPSKSVTAVVFKASGGTAPYGWSSSQTNDALGTLAATNDMAIYTPKAVAGSIFLTVQDAQGAAATATLIQQ